MALPLLFCWPKVALALRSLYVGKKTKSKKGSASLKSLANLKIRFRDEHDPLHEGRSFNNRKNSTWSAYRMVNRLCNDSEKDEQLGLLGESV